MNHNFKISLERILIHIMLALPQNGGWEIGWETGWEIGWQGCWEIGWYLGWELVWGIA
jgi:beta-lactamase class D